jgi:hypothetical protein
MILSNNQAYLTRKSLTGCLFLLAWAKERKQNVEK